MYHSNLIISRIESDRALALKLERALSGVKDLVSEQLNTIGDGARRLSYYASCLTDNYDDVCTKMKEEDFRFLLGISQIYKNRQIISEMIRIYVEDLLQRRNPDSITSIQRNLMYLNVNVSSGQLTKRGLVYSVTKSICFSLNINTSIDFALSKLITKYGVIGLSGFGMYGIFQHAAECADILRLRSPHYYDLLYVKKIEMMYFLIEPVIDKSQYINKSYASDSEIANAIARMVRS